jgi:Cu/Ag efflux protein CusF
MKKTLAALAVLVALPLAAAAQKPVTQTDGIEVSAKIEAIDKTNRLVTLTDADGVSETIYAGPEVQRFDALKVGDTVTFRYYESIAYEIRRPGQPSGLPKSTDPAVTRSAGTKPGATIAKQDTTTVTVKAIDATVPAITVVSEDGRLLDFKVENKKSLDGVKAGDKVEITYTQALMITVK